MFIVPSYLAYLAITLCVTVWVATTLHRDGRITLVEALQGLNEVQIPSCEIFPR